MSLLELDTKDPISTCLVTWRVMSTPNFLPATDQLLTYSTVLDELNGGIHTVIARSK